MQRLYGLPCAYERPITGRNSGGGLTSVVKRGMIR
jgi:hypothetical protein